MTVDVAFNPQRLAFARKRRGLSKTRLAQASGVPLRSLTAHELGEASPEDEAVRRYVEALNFPREFFFHEDIDEVDDQGVSFRSMSKMTATQRHTAIGAASIALCVNEWIEKRFVLPPPLVPDLSRDLSPEAAADCLRRECGLGEIPVRNMIHFLEARGVRVFSLAFDAREVDAFSFWRNGTPFVFLNTMKSAEHSRYDAAHELGHLCLHKHAGPNGQEAERQANMFASAFLMSKASVLARAPKLATLETLIRLKKTWTVSVMALARRLHDLEVVSDWQYHLLCKQASMRGFRTKEPEPARRESSQVLAKVLAKLREDGMSNADIARDLKVAKSEVDELMFGLTLTGIPGRAIGTSSKKKRHLTVISNGRESAR